MTSFTQRNRSRKTLQPTHPSAHTFSCDPSIIRTSFPCAELNPVRRTKHTAPPSGGLGMDLVEEDLEVLQVEVLEVVSEEVSEAEALVEVALLEDGNQIIYL